MASLFKAKDAVRYTMLPGIRPRMRDLFVNGFGYVPYFLAVVYHIVRLLPANHPYLSHSNMGKYGVRHVVFEAWRHLTFSLKNTDQIILFFVVICGLLVFFVQLIFFLGLLFMQPAMAAMPTNWAGFFTVDDSLNGAGVSPRSQDLAFMMLDMVFGIPHPILATSSTSYSFFESCVGSPFPCVDNTSYIQPIDLGLTGVTAPSHQFGMLGPLSAQHFPFPVHRGLHALLAVYSNGLLVIAVCIASYFVATVLAETAQSGTPFGRRFNKTWAPLRIVVAFGLLMPLNMGSFSVFGPIGLNSAQYIVLYAAKYGSGFATNGWRYFNATLTQSLGDSDGLISKPNPPDVSHLAEFMFVAKVCKHAYEHYALQEKRQGAANPSSVNLTNDELVWPYALYPHTNGTNSMRLPDPSVILALVGGMDPGTNSIKIRFGVRDADKFKEDHSNVSPICGEVNVTISDARDIVQASPGVWEIQLEYYTFILAAWYDLPPLVGITGGGAAVSTPIAFRRDVELACRLTQGLQDVNINATNTISCANNNIAMTSEYTRNYMNEVTQFFKDAIDDAVADQQSHTRISGGDPDLGILMEKGWAGAGIWYNRIAEVNGSLIAAAYAVPTVSKYPAIMEEVLEIKSRYDESIPADKRYEPTATGVGSMGTLLSGNEGQEFAETLYTAYLQWTTGAIRKEDFTGDPFTDAIAGLLGTDGLYDLRDNQGTHPLAMLVGIGRSLVESAVRSLGFAALSLILGKTFNAGALGGVAASFFVSVAMLGLTVGFVLYYVVPFLPFIYFFFAVGGWIKGIFEAMVGAPLWALAHIRIDGEGLSGQAALNGYFLILEVFLRPILTVFGLLASISIFSALVHALHAVFPALTSNVGGYDLSAEMVAANPSTMEYMRNKVDQFFFTVIYAIIVYMLAMSSFKLIDNIPNNILRWMGQSVATFGDQREDPAERLVSSSTIGSQQAMSKIGGGLQSIVSKV